MLDEILKVHQSGQLEEAEQRYREWLAFNPDDPEALHLLAIVRRQRDDLAEALELAQRAADLVPERANYQLTLAGLYLHARLFDRAREGFATALRLNPNLPGAALGVAQIALLQGDLDGTREALAKAERMAPEHPQVLAQKAGLAQARGEHDEAVKLYIDAAKRNPADPAIQANLARSFAALGKTAFAEQALRNAVALKPNYTVARIALGQLLLKEQRLDEALAEFEQVLAERPDHALALAGRGDIRRAQGNLAAAVDDYRQAHAAAPGVDSIAAALVQTLASTGQSDEAQSTLAAALQQLPRSAELRKLDLAFAVRADDERYLAACRAWHEADPTSVRAQERLATVLELRGRYDEADAVARAALARDSRAGFARLILARSALREGRPEDAQEQLNRVPESVLAPARRVERAQLRGLARDRLGDFEGAVDAWLGGQRLQKNLAPLVTLPDVAGIGATLANAAKLDNDIAPTFLFGLPGAGAESLVTLLRRQGLRVLGDRFGRRMRSDAIATGEFAAMAKSLDRVDVVEAFRDHYLAGLAAIDETVRPTLVDWLPFLDLRAAALIAAAFPNARLLLVDRDPRDALLTWLALGTPQALGLNDATAAADWLARARAHAQAARERFDASRVMAIASADLSDPTALSARLLPFLGIASNETAAAAPTDVLSGLAGLPTRLPDGRWRDYAGVLGTAFARFETIH